MQEVSLLHSVILTIAIDPHAVIIIENVMLMRLRQFILLLYTLLYVGIVSDHMSTCTLDVSEHGVHRVLSVAIDQECGGCVTPHYTRLYILGSPAYIIFTAFILLGMLK